MLHFLAGQLAGEHAFVQMLDVNMVEVPNDDGQNGQQGFAAVGGLGGWDGLAWQKVCGGNGVPHHEAGQAHDDGAPNNGQVFNLFGVIVATIEGAMLTQAQVVADILEQVLEVFEQRQHAPFDP